jgi:hypothetical protein
MMSLAKAELDLASSIQTTPHISGQRIISPVDSIDRDQHAHLWRDLNHLSVSRQARSKLIQSGAVAAFHWMHTLPPRNDSNSIEHSPCIAAGVAISSTNAGLRAFRRRCETPPSRFFKPA